jgi:hypothetical protein
MGIGTGRIMNLAMMICIGAMCAFATAAGCRPVETPKSEAAKTAKLTVTCGHDLHITEKMGARTDWGGTSVWAASAEGDTLVLSRRGSCGDECHYEERIIFTSYQTACPTFVSASITKTDAGSVAPVPRVQEASEGVLEIQDWHSDGGIVSGRLSAEFTLIFYARTPAPTPPGEK